MKKVGFIGAYDKTDLIVYIAKALTTLGKKVLVIDSTSIRKSKIHCANYKSIEILYYRI